MTEHRFHVCPPETDLQELISFSEKQSQNKVSVFLAVQAAGLRAILAYRRELKTNFTPSNKSCQDQHKWVTLIIGKATQSDLLLNSTQ